MDFLILGTFQVSYNIRSYDVHHNLAFPIYLKQCHVLLFQYRFCIRIQYHPSVILILFLSIPGNMQLPCVPSTCLQCAVRYLHSLY